MIPIYLLTFDSDWCPSWMVDEVLDLLDERGHLGTVYSTGSLASDTRERILSASTFELGIHPNFFEEGAVGNPASVVDPLLDELGPCTTCRTHGLFWWHGLGTFLGERGITSDSSLSAPGHRLSEPLRVGGIGRFPISWGDWSHLASPVPVETVFESIAGFGPIRVFNFHPVHIVMNTGSLEQWQEYRELIRSNPDKLKEIREAGNTHRHSGIRNLFLRLLEQVDPVASLTMSKAVEQL